MPSRWWSGCTARTWFSADSGKCCSSATKPTTTPRSRATNVVSRGRLRIYSSLDVGMPNHSGSALRILAQASDIDASKGTVSGADSRFTEGTPFTCAREGTPRRLLLFGSTAEVVPVVVLHVHVLNSDCVTRYRTTALAVDGFCDHECRLAQQSAS